jgi:hypothetical protein
VNEPREPDSFGSGPFQSGVDERLSDWVDGRLSSRDLERFEAELRVNPALRAQAEEYKRTVLAVRAALTGAGPRVDMVGRVLAAVQHGRIARPPVMTAANAIGKTTGRRPHWWAFAASSIVGAAAIVLFALLIDWQGPGNQGAGNLGAGNPGAGNSARDEVAKAPPPAYRSGYGKDLEDLQKAQQSPPPGAGGEQQRRGGQLTAAATDRDAGLGRVESRRIEELQANKLDESFAEHKNYDASSRAVSGQPPGQPSGARPAAPAAPPAAAPAESPSRQPAPQQPSAGAAPSPDPANTGDVDRRAFKDTRKPEGLAAGGDGGAKAAPDPLRKQRAGDDAAKREALRRDVVTQIVLSPQPPTAELEPRSRERADSKPFDLQAVAQGLHLQALSGVPLRAADVEQLAETADVDKDGADRSVVGKPPAAKAPADDTEAKKADAKKGAEKAEVARGVANRADAERNAPAVPEGNKTEGNKTEGDKKAPDDGTAWLVDGSPQEIRAFLARLGDAAQRAHLQLQNGEADADSVLALVPVQPQSGQPQSGQPLGGLQQKGGAGEPQAAGRSADARDKAKSPPADGPRTGGPETPQTFSATRGGPQRVRLVIVLRGAAPAAKR